MIYSNLKGRRHILAEKSTKTQTGKKKTAKKAATGELKPKKLSIAVDKVLYEEFIGYIEIFGYSKDGFVSDAIKDKLARDQISRMIDTIIKI